MSGVTKKSRALEDLRRRAEALADPCNTDAPDLSPDAVRSLVRELHTYQLELEMQNEELRGAQEDLMDAHERLSVLYDCAPVAYVTLNKGGLILEANLTAAAMFGVERDSLFGLPLTSFLLDADQDAYYKHRRAVAECGTRQTCELRVRNKEGGPIWAALESAPIWDGGDRTHCGLRIIITDVSETHQAQELARAAARDWETTFDAMEDAIVISGADGLIRRCNGATTRILGRPFEDIVGHSCQELLYGAAEWGGNTPYTRMAKSLRRECSEIEQDGRWIRVSVDPILDEDLNLTGAVHTMVDITVHRKAADERRHFDLQIQQTQKLECLGVMAGGIAHDFSNILYVILGNLNLALDDMAPEATGRGYFEQIQTATKRASELTDQMLAYSGGGALATEKLDLSGLVREMAQLLEVSHGKSALLKYQFEDGLPSVMGDASQLRQVVMNLITNASDAIGDGNGRITVMTGVTETTQEHLASAYAHDELPVGRYTYVEVTDNGCGMDEETRARIFEPFFTTKLTGRGLGMAAVLGIVRAHGGAIIIQSEPGHGTAIRVLLPSVEGLPERPLVESPEQGHWTGSGTILVVDDEVQIRSMLRLLLERRGFTVLTAEDGRQALALLQEHKKEVVCVLLDLTMPEMGGVETCANLRRIREDIKVILVSGYSEEVLQGRVEKMNFAGFLKKPVSNRVLLEKLRGVLASDPTTSAMPAAENT